MRGLSALAMEELRSHAWPGNVRELRNRVERAVALALGPWIMPGDLFPEPEQAGHRDARQRRLRGRPRCGRAAADRRALRRSGGRSREAAARLGISRTTMWEKMRRHGIGAEAIAPETVRNSEHGRVACPMLDGRSAERRCVGRPSVRVVQGYSETKAVKELTDKGMEPG